MTTRRRGMALLLVLSTLVVVVPALALLSSRSVKLHRQTKQSSITAMLDGSLSAIQDRLEAWLADESSAIVLPVDAGSPRTVVDELNWDSEGEMVSIELVAFDLRGMLPVPSVRDSPVGQRVLPEVARYLRDKPADEVGLLGLDGWAKRSVLDGGPSWYPAWGIDDRSATVPGELVAFDIGDLDLAPVLNINTAPWPLIEAVARARGITDLERLDEKRQAGERTASMPRSAAPDSGSTVRLVSSSDAWAFRVEARSGSARRSWWLVYVQDQQGWRLHRRVPIDA